MSLSAPSPADFPLGIDKDFTIGSVFIGMVISAVLWGISNLQVYIYYHEYPKDLPVYLISVAFLWIFDTLQLALTVHAVYYYLVSNFGDYSALLSVIWSLKMTVVTNVVIVDSVQIIYAYRLWRFNHGRVFLAWLVPFIVMAGVGIGVAVSIKFYKLHSIVELQTLSWIVYLTLGYVALVDFVIASTMCYYLQGSRSDIRFTSSLISKLLLWTVGTGLTTSICSLASLIAYATMPRNLVFIGLEMLLSKLYYNSLLAMLNARKSMRDTRTEKRPEEVFTTVISLPLNQDSTIGTFSDFARATQARYSPEQKGDIRLLDVLKSTSTAGRSSTTPDPS